MIRDCSRTSPSLAALGDLAERTFWRIVTILDDFGRYHGSPKALFAACYPEGAKGLNMTRFNAALEELRTGDLIRFYESDGRAYIYSPTWLKYQRCRSQESKFPEPTENKGRGHLPADVCKVQANAPVVVVEDVVVDDQQHMRSSERASPDAFEQFWIAYPKDRRRGKFEARQAWTKLRLTSAQVAQLMTSLEAWKRSHDWLKNAGKFIPWPQKFLNRRRWEETPDASPGPDLLEPIDYSALDKA